MYLCACQFKFSLLNSTFYPNWTSLFYVKGTDGELSQHMNTRVPSEPRYELRKRNNSQQEQNTIRLLIHKFAKLSIHEMN